MAIMGYNYRKGLAAGVASTTSNWIRQRTAERAGRGYSHTSTRTSRRRKTGGRGYTFRDQLLNNTHAQHKTIDEGVNGLAMVHNSIYSMSPTQAITQGTGNTNRIGDAISLEALKVRGMFISNTVANNYTYRLIIGYSGEEFNVPSSFNSGGLVTANIFLPTTGATYGTQGIINPKAFTVLDDRSFTINSGIAGVADVAQFDFTVALHTKFQYQDTASQYGKTKNLYMIAISTAYGGTPGSSGTGAVQIAFDLIFKNL